MTSLLRVLGIAALLAFGATNSPAAVPVAPCGAAPVPAPGPLGEPPRIVVAASPARDPAWTPPACSGWTNPGFRSLVAIAGRMPIKGGTAGVLARFGAISRLAGVKYWSASGRAWQRLIVRAHATRGTNARTARTDFTADEMASGRWLGFSQTDNDAGTVAYRMHVLASTPGRVVIASENAGTIRRFLIPLFSPGELQSLYVLERDAGDDVWKFYSLTRIGPGASALTDGHEASTINRAVAFYRHLAGIPTDQDPPAAAP